MNNGNEKVTDIELHGFVDGELSDSRARLVAGLIASDTALAGKVDRFREINRRLEQVYGDDGPAPLPSRFLIALDRRDGIRPWPAAAAMAWLAVGMVIGYLLQGPGDPAALVRPLPVEAAFAHAIYVPEIRHPVEVDASQQDHLNAWLSKRLNRAISAPDLREAGYALIGGRLLPDGHRPAAQFMYEDDSGERVTLYIRHALDDRETAFSHAENDGLGIVYWIDDGLAYALTAKAERDALTGAAELVYREVNP